MLRLIKAKRLDPGTLRMLILDEADTLLTGRFLGHLDKLLGALDRSKAVRPHFTWHLVMSHMQQSSTGLPSAHAASLLAHMLSEGRSRRQAGSRL